MKEEFEITVGPNGNKKEEKVESCFSCETYPICIVREKADKLIESWAKVSKNLNTVRNIYNIIGSDCKCYLPTKE